VPWTIDGVKILSVDASSGSGSTLSDAAVVVVVADASPSSPSLATQASPLVSVGLLPLDGAGADSINDASVVISLPLWEPLPYGDGNCSSSSLPTSASKHVVHRWLLHRRRMPLPIRLSWRAL
jgi:hypothetical protein